MEPRLQVSFDRLVTRGMEHTTPGLQGKWFIHYTTAAPKSLLHLSVIHYQLTFERHYVHGWETFIYCA